MKGKCRTTEEKIRYHTAMRPQLYRSGTRRAKDMRELSVNQDVLLGVIASFGFPDHLVQQAIACLYDRDPADDFGGSVNRVLSFKETCSILSLSKSGPRRLINKAEITPIRLSGRRIGFRLQDIQDRGAS